MGVFDGLFPAFAARRRARRESEAACRALRPAEPVLASVVCADEETRWVVRVFCGRRPAGPTMAPPWNECLIFGVPKGGGEARLLNDDQKYRPTLR